MPRRVVRHKVARGFIALAMVLVGAALVTELSSRRPDLFVVGLAGAVLGAGLLLFPMLTHEPSGGAGRGSVVALAGGGVLLAAGGLVVAVVGPHLVNRLLGAALIVLVAVGAVVLVGRSHR